MNPKAKGEKILTQKSNPNWIFASDVTNTKQFSTDYQMKQLKKIPTIFSQVNENKTPKMLQI
jgi:hypothetical protein